MFLSNNLIVMCYGKLRHW